MNKKIETVWSELYIKRKEIMMRFMMFGFIMIFMCGGILNKVMLCDADEKDKENKIVASVVEKENKYLFGKVETENTEEIEENENVQVLGDSTYVKGEKKEDTEVKSINKTGAKYTYDADVVFKKLREGNYSNDGKKVVFLTFDDGASNTVTPKILDILKQYDVKATFFVSGKIIEDGGDKAKELIKREFDEGHAIGNHSYSHEYGILYPNRSLNIDQFIDDFNKNDQILKSILGENFSTRVIRCPGGYMSWKNMQPLDEYLKANNKVAIDWNALSGDAEGNPKNSQQLFDYAVKTSGNYEMVVLLMHDTYGKEEGIKALPEIIKYFKSKGYEFKTIV